MCGRFTFTQEPAAWQAEFAFGVFPADWQPRYNVSPSQAVAVVADAGRRQVEWMRWGLVPSWAKDVEIGNRLINARAETLAEKPSFRQSFRQRRCVILADGFYEWQKPAGKGVSQPYYFRRVGGRPFVFAGLWDAWRMPDGQELRSCTIVTCAANTLVAAVHERMPVILDGDSYLAWLASTTQPPDLQSLLQPYPAGQMDTYPVARLVNAPGQDHADCISPINL